MKTVYLAGRCRNGAHRDSGTLYHALDTDVDIEQGPLFGKAVCGAEPGRTAYGWAEAHKPEQSVTCPRCLKKLERKVV